MRRDRARRGLRDVRARGRRGGRPLRRRGQLLGVEQVKAAWFTAAAVRVRLLVVLVRALVPVAAFLVFSVAVNDLADERVDRVNLPGDPTRPLVVGGALRREMTVTAAVAAAVALAGGFLLGAGPGLVTAAGLCVSA